MKALTIKQPWAWAVSIAFKDIENRSRNTNYRGEVAIHAGLTWSARATEFSPMLQAWNQRGPGQWRLKSGVPPLPGGAIIAIGWIIDSHPAAGCCKPWGEDEYDGKSVWHWVLADTKALPEPVFCRGALGLWTVPDHIELPDCVGSSVSRGDQ
jgi:hypothetical protein